MTEVLVVGMAVIDFLFEVDELPDSAEKFVAHHAQIVGGGGAANAACAIVVLGGHVKLAARVGNDMIGSLIIDDLERFKVDCSRITVSENGRSSYSSVLLDSQGERQIVNFRGSDLSDNTSQIQNTCPDSVLADTRWSAGAVAAMQLAHDSNVPGVLDAEAPLDHDAMTLASHIAFSRQGLESAAGALSSVSSIEAALRNVAKSYSGWLAMTDGAEGVYSLCDDTFCHQPATKVEVIDTLGAGDVWHGAFAYCLGGGLDEKSAVEFASATASLKCSKAGGGRACPSLQEVKQFMSLDC